MNRDGGQDLVPVPGNDGAAPRPDVASCQGLAKPDVDCYYGTPSYRCVENDGVSSWLFTCPERPQDPAPTDAGRDCSAIASYLAGRMELGRGRCTTVVRLDYQTLRIISHAFVCGEGAATDETSARQSATAAGYPYTSDADTVKSAPTDHDQWVFYKAPNDHGGVAAVSDYTGLATFAATIVWSGKGKILFPTSFDDTDMGQGCAVPSSIPVRGINLGGSDGDPRLEEAARIVLSTALPEATRHYGESINAVALLYPRSVGMFDPTTAEYIVLVNSLLLI